jgi:hypothetical protein
MKPANNHFCKEKSIFILHKLEMSVVPAIEPSIRTDSNMNNEPPNVYKNK